jgi:Response regulator containing a CheY-like receiver domain and an HTH DNA-binding domain
MLNENNSLVRILIVDDHPVVCSGLTSMLSAQPNLEVGASASSGDRALELIQRERFDVMLLDLRMPGMDGIAVLQKLKDIKDPPLAIVLTSFEKEEEIYRAIRAGAQGYLVKDTPEVEMVAAILAVASGKRYIPRDIAARLADRMLRKDLTSRELKVLELLAQGETNKQIAGSLHISDNTVRCHVNNIMEKLQVSDRTEAVANALKKGVLAGTD